MMDAYLHTLSDAELRRLIARAERAELIHRQGFRPYMASLCADRATEAKELLATRSLYR
jgi:hypothetical protein